jgi:hypothetical protein
VSGQCDIDIFENGRPVMLVNTGAQGGAAIFEEWVKRQSDRIIKGKPGCNAQGLSRVIDWHYSGGIAQVIVHASANFDAVKACLAYEVAAKGLPKDPKREPMRVIRWVTGAGLYRADVTPTQPGAIGAFMDPATGANVFI